MDKSMIRWEEIKDYIKIPCPICRNVRAVLQYRGRMPEFSGYAYLCEKYMFQCSRCEICMDFDEYERIKEDHEECL